jgi:hypothetical protein
VSVDTKIINKLEGPHIIFSGANIHVRSGHGITEDKKTGLGNLIVGYNQGTGNYNRRTGSHNVIVGDEHTFTSYGGVVAGKYNSIEAPYASVYGGKFNRAIAESSTILSGFGNVSQGNEAAILGGYRNHAAGSRSSIVGGEKNQTNALISVILDGVRRGHQIQPTDASGFTPTRVVDNSTH